MTTGQRIKKARKALGITQKMLGEKMGVTASFVGQYENDLRKPKQETILKFAEALNIEQREISQERGETVREHLSAADLLTALKYCTGLLGGDSCVGCPNAVPGSAGARDVHLPVQHNRGNDSYVGIHRKKVRWRKQ